MNLIEKVARAMAKTYAQNACGWQSAEIYEQTHWMHWTNEARAAIEAMQIPSAEMINAGINCDDWADGEQDATKLVSSTFSAMIKEAIK